MQMELCKAVHSFVLVNTHYMEIMLQSVDGVILISTNKNIIDVHLQIKGCKIMNILVSTETSRYTVTCEDIFRFLTRV